MARNLHKHPSITQKNDASCINNKRGMARRAKRNSNKRDRQALARETAGFELEIDMNHYEDSPPPYGSIWSKGYREAEWDNAWKALEWIKNALNMDRCSCHVGSHNGQLVFIHETYGPYINDYEDKFKQFAWASNQFCADGVWSCDTPFGKYTVILEYFDNHCTGY